MQMSVDQVAYSYFTGGIDGVIAVQQLSQQAQQGDQLAALQLMLIQRKLQQQGMLPWT